MLENTKGAIKTWTIQRNWQHWVHQTQDDILTPIIAYV